jgi:hypothetical protein
MVTKLLRRLWRHAAVFLFMPFFNRVGSTFYLSHRPDFAGSLDEKEMTKLTRWWEHGQLGNNRGDWPRLYFFIANVRDLEKRGVPGTIAEIGVHKGTTAKLLSRLAPNREMYLFDTYEGFSPRDTQKDPSRAAPGTFSGSLQEVKDFVGEAPHIHYCKGVFPDTSGMVPEAERFALVHIDCDLYEPTKAACEFFYPRLSPGGVLIIHDYHSGCWPGVPKAVDESLQGKPERLALIPDKSGTAMLVKSAM